MDCSGLADSVEVLRASHPVPDARSEAAALRLLDLASSMAASEHLLVLASGGGSALLAAPIEGLTLAHKADLSAELLASGASITEMNTVRSAVSRIKGGGLARAAAPGRVTTLVVSDVPGDDPAVVASGPTVPAQTTAVDALAVLDRYRIAAPEVRAVLTDLPVAPGVEAGDVRLVASAGRSLSAVAASLRDQGIEVIELGDDIEGEARVVARDHAARVRGVLSRIGQSGQERPIALLSGGETTVTVRGKPGRGGRNSEYALALAAELAGLPGVFALAADTDGIDGVGPYAGAFVAPDTLARLAKAGFDAHAALDAHDSASVFDAIGDLLITGATGTNVNDFRLVLLAGDAEDPRA